MEQLKNIIIYDSWFDIFDKLTEEQVGKFMMSISRWRQGKPLTCDDPLVLGVLWNAEKQLEDMRTNYIKKVESNRENGKKGGRPKKVNPTVTEVNPKNPMGYSKTQPNPQNLKEKEKEKEKESKNKNKKYNTIHSSKAIKEKGGMKFSDAFDNILKTIEHETV
tara:strand:+ start:172 stop:660 length:489 start_codon:yes stop_codon:yes gene_type:complete